MDIITKNESNSDYHSNKSISASGLKEIYKKSVYHYLTKKWGATSESMKLGSAVHSYVLEGKEAFDKEFFVWDKPDLRKKENKERQAEAMALAKNREIISKSQFDIVQEIQAHFYDYDLANHYTKGIVELSHYANYENCPVKVRPDCLDKDNNWISDIKTCQDNSPRAFRSDIYKYNYHLQAFFYCLILGIPVVNFRFLAVETKPPYTVEVYALNDEQIKHGEQAFNKAFLEWKHYYQTGNVLKHITQYKAQDGALIL